MLWIPEVRKTRQGTTFSPYASIAPLTSPDFDFAPLLVASSAQEPADGDLPDHEHHTNEPDEADDFMNEVDDTYPPPSPPDPWNEVDDVPERPTPPPPKRRRTAVDDMLDCKKPLTHSHRNRKSKRAKLFADKGNVARLSTVNAHARAALATPLHHTLDAQTLPVAYGGYGAKVEDAAESKGRTKARTLEELVRIGFKVVEWNGFDARPLVDARGRIFAVLAGQPRDAGWASAVERVYRVVSAEGTAASFPAKMHHHRRGLFAAVNVGLSYGKGQRIPSRLLNPRYDLMLDRLLKNPDIDRMATFASAAFSLWAPRLYRYYWDHKEALLQHLPQLRLNFPRSVFSCATFNFGPNVWTFRHRDGQNVPFGWCGIQAAGPFDPTKGGHLVLWNLRLAVEFPPGALILVPSATIAHSNVPVQEGDYRISFTQYTAGGLMRYVDNGFRTEGELAAEDPEEFKRMAALKESRWEIGLGLLSTVDELLERIPDE
ncbi:hypothetical protein B0H15DRAFT_957355 [Mycena belliarum]|uniref:Uncharacterized protein n=1 Tax=Mycena belliarum TaxID=1033014 RepID=A0AAD6TQ25_9AGAR|nr:hypothetical protein B0H15DRAFT_957355 [Mycena belliae]